MRDAIDIDQILDQHSNSDDNCSSEMNTDNDKMKREQDIRDLLEHQDLENKLYKVGSRSKNALPESKSSIEKANPYTQLLKDNVNSDNDINIFNSRSLGKTLSENKDDTVEAMKEQKESDLNDEQGHLDSEIDGVSPNIDNNSDKQEARSKSSEKASSYGQKNQRIMKNIEHIISRLKEETKDEEPENVFDQEQMKNIDDFVNADLDEKEDNDDS
mmetsp:Transcript_25793/g.29730  ORF Transcript_25793/g.29730 Transcript_25793/m.29730 type:complete len:215 (-) Transcript_25793:2994-3638(-)